ncbi:MAG: exodeoxyribonuclease V subunit gamma [Clostridia bacterium]|nr:exodeoxyribonuclease V subunit gamma [Clostridia bacterium]
MNAVLKAYTLSECMEVMAEYAKAYEEQGGVNLIFCEDRLTLLAERALVNCLGGTFRSHVSTFARLLSTEERVISKQGSVMAVGEVMTRLQREGVLQCFTSLSGIGNNARCIYETLAQMSASEITPDILKESLALLPDDMLKKKVSDLALIYEGYLAFLQEGGFVDESKYLSLLPRRLRKEGLLKGVNVFFLCYNSFTAQARETVRAAIETAANVVGVFCAGEEELYTNRAYEIFARVCGEYGKVRILDKGTPLDGDAEILRKGLFNPVRAKNKKQTERIRLYEAENKMAEAEYVAVKIRRAMAENQNARYRDFAVLTPDILAYSLPLKKAFAEYGIPYFIDEKKSLKSHPVSRFLLDCFRTVKEGFSPTAVQSLTQNIFFGESDEYRNYLLKFANYRGGAKRPIKTGEAVEGYDIAYLEGCREKVLLATENIKARGHGRGYCTAVRKILADFKVEDGLKELENKVEDVAQKSYLAQISKVLEKVLAEAELLTGAREMTAGEFEAVLCDGLDAAEISLIPLKSDAVFIGDITESRIEKVRTLFAMGMTDAVPRCGADTAIVSDKEIARLADVKALIEPTVAEVNLRARESVCLNLCAFLEELHLSYPLSADGSEPAVSDIYRYIDTLFCSKEGKKLARRKKLEAEDFPYLCSAPVPAVRQLLIEKSQYEAKKEDTRLEYSSLFTALDKLSVTEKDDYLKNRGGQVCVERGEELFFKNGKVSPTSLEGYFSCPFRHFAERGLKLKEREEATVLAVDTGNFVHELLERVSQQAATIPTEEEFRAYAMGVGAELLKRSVYAMQQDTASGLVFSEKLLKEGADVALALYKQIKNSDFKVEQTEAPVNAEFFHGKVDRVDGTDKYVRVVDYKTGSIDDTATSYYTGRKIQMQMYMSELKGERVPAGVFYFPASVDYRTDDEGRFRMKGFLNGSEDALLCGDKNLSKAAETVKSEYFPAALKNGAAAKRVMEEEVFSDFIDYSVLVARQGCKEMKEGFIAPTPYEGNCEYCKYGGMCGFNKEAFSPRKESAIEPNTIANIAKESKEGK